MSPIGLGHPNVSFLCLHHLSYGVRQLKGSSLRPMTIPFFNTIIFNYLIYRSFRVLRLVPPPSSLSACSLKGLRFVGQPIQVACFPLMKLPLLPQVPIPRSPRARGRISRLDLLLIRSLSGVTPCVFQNIFTQSPFLTYCARLKDALAFHPHPNSSTLPWSLTMLFSVKKRNTSCRPFPLTFHSPWHRHQTFRAMLHFTLVFLKTQSSSLMDPTITPFLPRNIRSPQQTSRTISFPRRPSSLTTVPRIFVMGIPLIVTGTLRSLPRTILRVWQRCVPVNLLLRIVQHPHLPIQALQHLPIPLRPLMNKTSRRSPGWRKIAGVTHLCLLCLLAPTSVRTTVSACLAQRNGEYNPSPPFQFPAPVQCVFHAVSPAASRCVKLWVT